MITCGNCGKPVGASDTTCAHCDALLAAWESATDVEQPDHRSEQPDYAQPPATTWKSPGIDRFQTGTPSGIRDFGPDSISKSTVGTGVDHAAKTRLVNAVSAVERTAASRLINIIHAYARQREEALDHTRPIASQRQNHSTYEGVQRAPISNMAFAIGTVLVVALILMWGIVAAMVYTDTLSVVFIAITIVLTIAYKPILGSLRSPFRK